HAGGDGRDRPVERARLRGLARGCDRDPDRAVGSGARSLARARSDPRRRPRGDPASVAVAEGRAASLALRSPVRGRAPGARRRGSPRMADEPTAQGRRAKAVGGTAALRRSRSSAGNHRSDARVARNRRSSGGSRERPRPRVPDPGRRAGPPGGSGARLHVRAGGGGGRDRPRLRREARRGTRHVSDVPDEVRRLAAEREERRAAHDFGAADALRDRIAELGFRIVDSPQGSTLEPLVVPKAAPAPRLRAREVASVLGEPPTADVSIHWVCEGWPEDLERALTGFRRHAAGRSVQFVVADTTGRFGEGAFGNDVEVLPLEVGTGWAAARNAGLRRSRGRVILAADPSVEPTGDVLGPLEAALADPTVGVCGPFGVVTSDLREFEPSRGPDVDAIEGY